MRFSRSPGTAALVLPLLAARRQLRQHAAARLALVLLRRRLVEGRMSHPLFDSARFTADLEALYERMAERASAGLAPEHLPAA